MGIQGVVGAASAGGGRGAASLRATAAIWLAVAMIGQVVFAVAVAAFYGRAAARGDMLGWDRFMTHGYLPGHGASNAVVAAHVMAAVLVTALGAFQLVPGIRRRAPALHRWNGRVYLTAVVAVSAAGLSMVWLRGTPGNLAQHIGISLNAVMAICFVGVALRYAMARNIAAHRRWALRLFVVAPGVWFFRVGFFVVFAIAGGPFGFNPRTFSGPALAVGQFAQFLLPLAVLEVYLRVRDRGSEAARFGMAAGLAALTLVMAGGIGINAVTFWAPDLAAPFAATRSVREALSPVVLSAGVDPALARYAALRKDSGGYDFSEDELNVLGYELIHAGRFPDAVRILRLNAGVFPASGNAFDSLGEAYWDAGDRLAAIASYRKSLALNPRNANAVEALGELLGPGGN